jgi:hypothetical protein
VPDAQKWGGWSAPPVGLSGDTVYVGTDDVVRTVDWRTGEVGETDTIPPGNVDLSGGRAMVYEADAFGVVDVATGEVLLTVPMGQTGWLDLSPDGRFAMMDAEDGLTVFDIDADTTITLDGVAREYGWSADGNLVRLADGHVVTCSTATGECTPGTETIPKEGGGLEPKDVRFAGQTFES